MNIHRSTALRKCLVAATLAAATVAASPSAKAYMALIYELDRRYAAGFPDVGTRMSATFIQAGVNTVELTLRVNNIGSPNAFVQNWWFNFNGLPQDLQVVASSASGTTPGTLAYGTSNSQFMAGRDGIQWDFSFYSGGTKDLHQGDTITYALYSASGLDIDQFNSSTHAGGVNAPNFYSGANVRDGATTQKYLDFAPRYESISGPPPFVLVPEASTVYLGFLLFAGAVGGEIFRRKRDVQAPAPQVQA